ncbi:SIR2 family protein [Micromonospora ureilytica]|uniref:SIR2 family protein n=1 Tax=Micromonospora ureilytica TaxID=709868 RepID=UPI0033D5DBB8
MGRVNIPTELTEAHTAGQLVLFIGAGASVDAPSGLPLFDKLASRIAQEAHQHVQPGERPDHLLGRIDDQQVDIHLRIQQIVDAAGSQPNRLHRALVALALAMSPVRIVTTNYDRHLSTVLREHKAVFDEYAGPAVPMGDDFNGIVYLHGKLDQPAKRLIATDRDFGEAYLRAAWAARFLERMFAEYTVLFVGYSHTDVVMSYLARALSANRRRYVLTDKPDNPDWAGYGVTPIAYESVGSDHSQMAEAIEKWAARAAMGLLDHRQRIKDLVSTVPSNEPEDMSYLEDVLADSLQAEQFCSLASGESWLAWTTTRPEFQQMFNPGPATSGSAAVLARWFVMNFVLSADHTSEALSIVHQAGGRLGPDLSQALSTALYQQQAPYPPWLAPWVVLIMADPAADRPLERLLASSQWPEDRAIALLLFDHLTQPVPILKGGYRTYLELRLRGGRAALSQAWKDVFKPNLTEIARPVAVIVERHLNHAFTLLQAVQSASEKSDPISSRRTAIVPHEQDAIPQPIDPLIDAARDCLETLLAAAAPAGLARLHEWAEADVPLLRRLAVHGWTIRTDVDATAKISWLLDRRWLFAHALRYEVFALIEEALPDAAPSVANALVADAAAGPEGGAREELDAYVTFNALAWMNRCAPALTSASEAFAAVRAAHPEFEVREHPNLLRSWTVSAGSPPSIEADDLHERITTDPAAALRHLRELTEEEESFSSGVYDILSEAVRDHPRDGFTVLDAAGGDNERVINAVVAGWSTASFPDQDVKAVLDRLTSPVLAVARHRIAGLLADGGRSDQHPTHWYRWPAARRLAADIWATADRTLDGDDPDDWLTRAINRDAGKVALFWVHAVADDWRTAGDSWSGLDSETRADLEALLDTGDARSALAETVLASQTRLFFGADRTWCEEHLLPLLAWDDPARVGRAWNGFLAWGRFDNQMLEAGLAELYLDAARHLGDFTGDMQRQLHGHLAAVAAGSELTSILNWVQRLTAALAVDERVEWLNQVGIVLAGLPVEAVEHQWNRWMRRYWQDRLVSKPRVLEMDEASAMASWTLHLTDSVADAVDLAVGRPARLLPIDTILSDLAGEDRLRRAAASYGRLLAHLLESTEQPFYDGYFLHEIVQALKTSGATDHLQSIVVSATRLGITGAADWI